MIRIGVVSDVHVGDYMGTERGATLQRWLEYILRWYKHQGVDVMVITGDLCNGFDFDLRHDTLPESEAQWRTFGPIWNRVFGGTETERVFVFGNHDRLLDQNETANGGTGTYWLDAFGEPYEPVYTKKVGGYTFVAAHWDHEVQAGEALERAVKESEGRPVFYVMHDAVWKTVSGSHVEYEGDPYADTLAKVREMVKDYDNLVMLTGHLHNSVTDERSIWQSKDANDIKGTVIDCATLNYAMIENRLPNSDYAKIKQGLYITVDGKDIDIRRLTFGTKEMYDFLSGKKKELQYDRVAESLGSNWTFTVGGEKKYDHKTRAEKAEVPEFPEDAGAVADMGEDYAMLSFPPAHMNTEDDIVLAYVIEAVDAATDKVEQTKEIDSVYFVDRSAYYLDRYNMTIMRKLDPKKDYYFRIYAKECFGKCSEPLIVSGVRP